MIDSDDIQTRTHRALEWERLKSFLAAQADSACGKEACLTLQLFADRESIQKVLDETHEAVSLLEGRSALSAGSLPDLQEVLQRLEVGAALAGSELLAIRSSLLVGKRFRSSLALLPEESFPRLTQYLKTLPQADKVLQEIEKAIDDSGNIKDEASTTLRQLRREVQKIDGSIKETLLKIIHSSSQSKALVEPLYTQRNGRYVLPVNANMRSAINGIVHDSSASGLTVYVEPMAVLELSNKLRLKETEVEREIARILEELSRIAATHFVEIKMSFWTSVTLDAIMARGRLALKYRGELPELSEDAEFDLAQARHPLLVLQDPDKTVVPNDIKLGGKQGRTLVITGPNTGGKTVLLKTLGIFALMLRAGLLLPVSRGSKAAIFTQVCADIGDEQSLEQSLSTFSSHMKNIVAIVDQCGPGWLILLDEVGAGTDPREGAALARAVLEHLNSSGAVTVSTTHYGELKTLAYTEDGFVNGSLDFDEQTLSPTYRLRLGVPGSSKATTIAKRLGLNPKVIERAQELVEIHEQELQKIIDQLQVKLQEAAIREEQAAEAKKQAEELLRIAQEQVRNADSESESLKRKHVNELETDYRLGRDYIKHLIADLQKQPSISKAQKAQQDLEEVRDELGWKSNQPTRADAKPQLSIGQNVKVISLNQRGIIADITPESTKNPETIALVRCGNLKVKVPISDLEIIEYQHPQKQKSAAQHKQQQQHGKPDRTSRGTFNSGTEVFVRTLANTLDLRGQRVDEALINLEHFLDDSMLSGVSPLMVIHGHGTGAVKSAVREYLNNSQYAGSFRSGEAYEGGDGVTMISI